MLLRFTIAYVAIIIFALFAFFYQSNIFKLIGFGSIMLSLGLYYGFTFKWSFTLVDKLIYLICVIGFLGDILQFVSGGEIGQLVQIVFTLTTYLLYVSVFRREGSYFIVKAKAELPKFMLITMVIFLFFGFVLLERIPDSLYFLSIIYAFFEVIFIILSFYRPTTNKLSYFLVGFGAIFKFVADIFYSYHHFVSEKDFFLAMNVLFYALSQYCLIVGVSENIMGTSKSTHQIIIQSIEENKKSFINEFRKLKIQLSYFLL
ncbi:MAG: hypothetical protein ACK4NY_21515 [Spirosomataceae bacterium]